MKERGLEMSADTLHTRRTRVSALTTRTSQARSIRHVVLPLSFTEIHFRLWGLGASNLTDISQEVQLYSALKVAFPSGFA